MSACVIVAGAVLAVPLAATLRPMAPDAPDALGASGAGLHLTLQESDLFAQMDQLEALADAPSTVLPAAFEDEVGLPVGARDVRAGDDAMVVGFLLDMSPTEALTCIEAQLAGRGWTAVPLGGLDGVTFVKSEGAYRWLLATCTQVGSATSVVMRGDSAWM